MKIYGQTLALAFFSPNVWETSAFAFTSKGYKLQSNVVLQSTPLPGYDAGFSPASAGERIAPEPLVESAPLRAPPGFDLFPVEPTMERIDGAKTVRTYKMPIWAERCQVVLSSFGRPLKAEANLWIGPIRKVHTLKMDSEDGTETPVRATLRFKKLAPVLKVSTSNCDYLPILAGVYVPSPERSLELGDYFDEVWGSCSKDDKKLIQGQIIQDEGLSSSSGAIRYWNIPAEVESVQLLGWSKNVGKKSFKLDVEVLQGPNNIKQKYFLQCGGSTQPYHAVLQTPGDGCTVRMRNKKFLEDGLVEFAVVPYEYQASAEMKDGQLMSWGT